MTYIEILSINCLTSPVIQTRWGQLRRELPQPFSERFREIIDTRHIKYGYDGNYPIDDVDEEFQRYRDLVEQFVDDLEQTASSNLS